MEDEKEGSGGQKEISVMKLECNQKKGQIQPK